MSTTLVRLAAEVTTVDARSDGRMNSYADTFVRKREIGIRERNGETTDRRLGEGCGAHGLGRWSSG